MKKPTTLNKQIISNKTNNENVAISIKNPLNKQFKFDNLKLVRKKLDKEIRKNNMINNIIVKIDELEFVKEGIEDVYLF